MARPSFVELRVYKLSEELADSIWHIVSKWRGLARDTVGKQLIRAADSIGANIAEGAGRQSFQDNRRFVRVARGSLNETHHWLRRAFRRKLLQQNDIDRLARILDELGPKLNAFLNSIGKGHSESPRRAPKRSSTRANGQQTTDNGP